MCVGIYPTPKVNITKENGVRGLNHTTITTGNHWRAGEGGRGGHIIPISRQDQFSNSFKFDEKMLELGE